MLTGITLILIIFISTLIAFYFEQFILVFKNCKIYVTSLSHPNAHKNERQWGRRKESLMTENA